MQCEGHALTAPPRVGQSTEKAPWTELSSHPGQAPILGMAPVVDAYIEWRHDGRA